jgi:hypothetical protein
MRADLFVTPVYTGNIEFPDKVISKYTEWVKFKKELDSKGASESTTQDGWQYIFKNGEPVPDWLEMLSPVLNEIKEEIGFVRTKNIWTVDYSTGGYQDPHFHTVGVAKVYTIIINLIGKSEIVIQDPRPIAMGQGYGFAHIESLYPGKWLSMPAYVVHNSRPCKEPRSILVMDVYVKDGL